jgi:TatA/E family protein of Tat protein translocase
MLSVPHMIVVFIVVLVVFGPQKLPELARSFGKLMAEFRKASGDFRSAFEEEMRDLERQARVAELKKQAAESIAAAEAITAGTAAAGATLAEHIIEGRGLRSPVRRIAERNNARNGAGGYERSPFSGRRDLRRSLPGRLQRSRNEVTEPQALS